MTEVTQVSRKEEKKREETYVDPDGGWGWCVVIGSFLCNLVLDGIAYSFGVLLQPLHEDLKIGVGSISLIGGVLAGVILATGPIAAFSVNKFGNQITLISGSIISSCAIFCSSFCYSLVSLVISYGLIAGFGLGLMYVPSVVAVGEYFTKRLSFATGICICGSGVGTFLIAPLTSLLTESYGWRGCNRVMAALCLACSLCGFVMVPNKKQRPADASDNTEEPVYHPEPRRGLLSNRSFVLIILGNMPFVMGIYTSYTYLPAMAVQNGLSSSNSAFLISVVGMSNTIGRLITGWMADLEWTSPLGISISTSVAVAFSVFILPFCTQLWSFIIVSSLYGLLLSSLITVSTPLLVQLLGIQQLNMAFGILTFARGVAGFLGPPVSGIIIDNSSDNINIPFFICSGLYLSTFLIYIIVWVSRRNVCKQSGYISL